MFKKAAITALFLVLMASFTGVFAENKQTDSTELEQEVAILNNEIDVAKAQLTDSLIKSDNISAKKKKQLVKAIRKALSEADEPSIETSKK